MNIVLLRPIPYGLGSVTQWFGEHPEWYARFNMSGHNGIDYGCAVGTSIMAAHDGMCEVGNDPSGYGKFVRVVGVDYITIYAHMSEVKVVSNLRVIAGKVIGLVGNTGNSTGPHLHFGLKINGMRNPAYLNWIDPVPFRTR